MLRFGSMALLILLNYVLQSTVLEHIAILGVKPDTALILIVSYGILRGEVEGGLFGLCAGLVHDILGSYFIGLYALLGLLTGYISGKPFKNFFHDNYFLPFIMVVAASLGYQFLFYCCSFLFLGKVDFWYYAATIILPKAIYTASLAIPLYSLLYFLNARIEAFEKSRRSLFKDLEEDGKKGEL